MASEKRCVRDFFARDHFKRHGHNLTGRDAKEDIENVLSLGDDTIAALEAKHAANRRVVTRRSVQSSVLTLQALSSTYIRRCKQRLHRMAWYSKTLSRSDQELRGVLQPSKLKPHRVRKGGGGGSYNAFMSHRCSGIALTADVIQAHIFDCSLGTPRSHTPLHTHTSYRHHLHRSTLLGFLQMPSE